MCSKHNISLQVDNNCLKFKVTWFLFQASMQKVFCFKLFTICFTFVCAISCFLLPTLPAEANNFVPTIMASVLSFSADRPSNLGVKNGKLGSCPASLNCVSSESSDSDHQIDPLTYESTPEEAIAQLKEILEAIDNAQIIQEQDDYLYAEFTSKLMGFVDDVEFYLEPEAQIIQVRSASRLGESDLGVNRKRIEEIRAKFNA